jgi:hypoxanthine phosphoribosyltransferase
MEFLFGIGGLGTGVVGVILTVYYARKSDRINKMRKRLEWPDLQAAATDLGRKIKRDFQPVALVTPGLTGATFANLLVHEFPNQPPVYVGTRTWKDQTHGVIQQGDWFVIETKKWIVTIPSTVVSHSDGTILIVDDFVMSGDFLDSLRSRLESAGVDPQRIRAASIAATRVAIANHKAPEYYWWLADNDDFYFPWGKAQ